MGKKKKIGEKNSKAKEKISIYKETFWGTKKKNYFLFSPFGFFSWGGKKNIKQVMKKTGPPPLLQGNRPMSALNWV